MNSVNKPVAGGPAASGKRVLPVLAFLAGLFSSCESLVGTVPRSRLPEVESRLVVHSYISPQDTVLYVIVTESVPVFGIEKAENQERDNVVRNARVTLSGDTRSVELQFDPVSRLYSAPASALAILPGHTYELRVSDGQRAVTAKTTVPGQAVEIASYRMDTLYIRGSIFGGSADTVLSVKFSWKDPAGARNYFRARSFANVSDRMEQIERNRVVYQEQTYMQELGSELQSDNNRDGKMLDSNEGRLSLRGFESSPPPSPVYPRFYRKLNYVDMELLHVSEPYFAYHRSVEAAGEAEDNPFIEPGIHYSNIEGGLGTFSSYHKFVLRFYFHRER